MEMSVYLYGGVERVLYVDADGSVGRGEGEVPMGGGSGHLSVCSLYLPSIDRALLHLHCIALN